MAAIADNHFINNNNKLRKIFSTFLIIRNNKLNYSLFVISVNNP